MPVIVHPIAKAGAVTQPTSTHKALLPSAEAERAHGGTPVSTCRLPFGAGLAFADGISPLRSVFDGNIDGISLLAPSAACTAATTGARATAVYDLDDDEAGSDYVITDQDVIIIGKTVGVKSQIKFVDTLSPTASTNEVWIDGGNGDALDNLILLLSQTGVEGVNYETQDPDEWNDMEVSASDTTTVDDMSVTIRSKEYGTGGNSFFAWLSVQGGAGDPSLGSQGTGTGTTGYFENGADASGTAPSPGEYRYSYTYVRSADGAESGRSPDASLTINPAQNTSLSGLVDPSPADASIDFIRIYRTEDTGIEFFRVGEIETGGAGTYADSTADGEDDGSLQGYNNVPFDDLAHKQYRGGMAPRGRVVAAWGGRGGARLWTGGAWILEDYSVGTASVTNGTPPDTATVTLSTAAVPTDDMRFNTFQVDGDSETYTIMAVAEATRVLTLDRFYQGTTDGTASYTIKDTRDANQAHASEELLYNQWPVDNNPGGVDPEDDDIGITAFVPKTGYMLMFSRTGRYALTGDGPDSWAIDKLGDEGCVSQGSVVNHGSTSFWISPSGDVYAQVGDGVPSSISSPDFDPTNTLPFGIDRTTARINWKHAHLIEGVYCEDDEIIMWAAPVDGASYNNEVLVFDVAASRWMTDSSEHSAMVCTVDADGNNVCLAGDMMGNLWHADHTDATNSDGAFGFEPVQAVGSSSTTSSLDLASGTPYPTSGEGLAGVPVTIGYADGSLAHAIIESNTSSVLTLRALLTTAPSSGERSSAGCIPSIWKSGRFHAGDKWDASTIRSIQIGHQKDSDGEFHFAYADDEDSTLRSPDVDVDVRKGDFTHEDRATRFTFDERTYGAQIQITILEQGLTTAALTYFTTDVEGRRA